MKDEWPSDFPSAAVIWKLSLIPCNIWQCRWRIRNMTDGVWSICRWWDAAVVTHICEFERWISQNIELKMKGMIQWMMCSHRIWWVRHNILTEAGCNITAIFPTGPVSKRSGIVICPDAEKYQLSQSSSSSKKFEAEGTLTAWGGITTFLYHNLERAAAVVALPVFPGMVSITVHYPLVRSPTEAFPSA